MTNDVVRELTSISKKIRNRELLVIFVENRIAVVNYQPYYKVMINKKEYNIYEAVVDKEKENTMIVSVDGWYMNKLFPPVIAEIIEYLKQN